jgi:hypothetical protein
MLEIDVFHPLHLVADLEDLQEILVEMIAIIIVSQFLDELYDGPQVIICNQ